MMPYISEPAFLITGPQNRVMNIHHDVDLLPVLLLHSVESNLKCFSYIHLTSSPKSIIYKTS